MAVPTSDLSSPTSDQAGRQRPPQTMVRPDRDSVRLLPLDRRPPCWRCDVTAGRTGELVAA